MLTSWWQARWRIRPTARPLIPAPLRPLAVAIVAACATVTVLLGVWYAGQSRAGALDQAIDPRIQAAFASRHAELNAIARLGEPVMVGQLSVALFAACVVLRWWRGAVLVAVAPPAAGAITEFVLKPLIGRTMQGQLSLPSGHTTGAFALAVTLTVLLADRRRCELPVAPRSLLAAAALATAAAVAISLVGLAAHYLTDTVAGAAVGTGVTVVSALVIDRLCGTPRPPSSGQVPGHRAAGRPTCVDAWPAGHAEEVALAPARTVTPERGDEG
jgi:undecaprenyl-diphosphatase